MPQEGFMATQDLVAQYGITRGSLLLRQEYLRLTEEEARLLESKISRIQR